MSMVRFTVRRLIEDSVTFAVLEEMVDRLQGLLYGSRIARRFNRQLSTLTKAWTASRTSTESARGRSILTRYTRQSRVASVIKSITGAIHSLLATATPSAVVTRLSHWFAQATRHSFLYRWLTAEPEPEVIVIDLRETYSVGPVIAVLDRTIATVTPGVSSATVTQAARALITTFRHRPISYASLCLLALIAASLALTAVTGRLTRTTAMMHFVLAILAALGTRSNASASDIAETQTYQTLIAIFEPPEPPEREE